MNTTRRALLVALLGGGGAAVVGSVARAADESLRLYTEEYPPVTFSREGRPAGLAVEVVEEIMKRLGASAPIEVVPWARGYRAATTEPNVGLFATTRTAEREPLFHWVGPISSTRAYLYARRGQGARIVSLEQAREVDQILVPREWYLHQILRGMGFNNLKAVGTPADVIRMHAASRGALMALDESTVAETMRGVGIAGDPPEPVLLLSEAIQYITFSRDTPASVARRWQAALDDMKRDGSFAAIYARWLPGVAPPR